jgi:hypothetical protein
VTLPKQILERLGKLLDLICDWVPPNLRPLNSLILLFLLALLAILYISVEAKDVNVTVFIVAEAVVCILLVTSMIMYLVYYNITKTATTIWVLLTHSEARVVWQLCLHQQNAIPHRCPGVSIEDTKRIRRKMKL